MAPAMDAPRGRSENILHESCVSCVAHTDLCKLTPVAVPAVLHSGEYYLFESDSEDEEETPCEEPAPQRQTACQVGTYIYTEAFEYVLLIGQ